MPTVVRGALELRKALKQFSPDLAKETQKEIASILKPITREARGFVEVPLSGWAKRPNSHARYPFVVSEVTRGIGYKTKPSKPNRRGFVALAQIRNRSIAGAIYETAGRKTRGGNFVPHLDPLYATKNGNGRLIFRAWQRHQDDATKGVIEAIRTAANKLNARATTHG